jgi:hypothetical protein
MGEKMWISSIKKGDLDKVMSGIRVELNVWWNDVND